MFRLTSVTIINTPRLLCGLLGTWLMLGSLSAADASSAPAVISQPSRIVPQSDPSGQWSFHLLPKMMQSDPELRMTVMSEMTDAGRQRKLVTQENPAYYAANAAGFLEVGDEPIKTAPNKKLVEQFMTKALARNGFLPAAPGHPPTLFLVYHWGVFGWTPSESVKDQMDNLIKRAAFVGGRQFAEEAQKAANLQLKETEAVLSNADHVARMTASSGDQDSPTFSAASIIGQFASPNLQSWNRFKDANLKNDFLVNQLMESFYFVVVSAFDYESVAKNKRVLLWRSHMTVELGAMSMSDCIPSLITQSSPFLGRDLESAATLTRKSKQNAEANIGELEVVGYDDVKKDSKATGKEKSK